MQDLLTVEATQDYLRVNNIEDALVALAIGPRLILAGGTDVFPRLQDRQLTGHVLDISGISELSEISSSTEYWHIGATVSWRDISDANLPPAFDGLKAAAREVGSVQIQNRATLVGNLCNASPAADGIPPLLTLDAEVELSSKSGVRYLMLTSFIQGNRKTAICADEMVTGVRIPKLSTGGNSGFLKLGTRSYMIISISMAAIRIETDIAGVIVNAAVSIGACSEVAQRMLLVEKQLIGRSLEKAVDQIDSCQFVSLAPIDDVRATAAYRRNASIEIVRRLLLAQKTDFENSVITDARVAVS
jgi:CO/xanthine dehydrogenase FAD-binding subunit